MAQSNYQPHAPPDLLLTTCLQALVKGYAKFAREAPAIAQGPIAASAARFSGASTDDKVAVEAEKGLAFHVGADAEAQPMSPQNLRIRTDPLTAGVRGERPNDNQMKNNAAVGTTDAPLPTLTKRNQATFCCEFCSGFRGSFDAVVAHEICCIDDHISNTFWYAYQDAIPLAPASVLMTAAEVELTAAKTHGAISAAQVLHSGELLYGCEHCGEFKGSLDTVSAHETVCAKTVCAPCVNGAVSPEEPDKVPLQSSSTRNQVPRLDMSSLKTEIALAYAKKQEAKSKGNGAAVKIMRLQIADGLRSLGIILAAMRVAPIEITKADCDQSVEEFEGQMRLVRSQLDTKSLSVTQLFHWSVAIGSMEKFADAIMRQVQQQSSGTQYLSFP